jgi:hypothetical protein
LLWGKRRPPVVCDWNVPHLEANCAVDPEQITIGVKAEVLFGEETNNRNHTE